LEALNLSSGILSLKISSDGYKLIKTSGVVNMYFTLFNLGELIHSPHFVFTLGIILRKQNIDLFKNNFGTFEKELFNLQQQGFSYKIKYKFTINNIFRDELKHFGVEIFICCDYSLSCTLLEISPSGDCFCCWCTVY
jgi:hypothetical protein